MSSNTSGGSVDLSSIVKFDDKKCEGSIPMSRKYELVRYSLPKLGAGFFDAFRMAIVEMTCLGERRFDLSGYPYETHEDALMHDWASLGQDFENILTRTEYADVEKLGSKSAPAFEIPGQNVGSSPKRSKHA